MSPSTRAVARAVLQPASTRILGVIIERYGSFQDRVQTLIWFSQGAAVRPRTFRPRCFTKTPPVPLPPFPLTLCTTEPQTITKRDATSKLWVPRFVVFFLRPRGGARCLIEWLRSHGARRGGILDRLVLYFGSRSTPADAAHYAFCATSHCAIARRIVNTDGERKQRTKRNDSRGENREGGGGV